MNSERQNGAVPGFDSDAEVAFDGERLLADIAGQPSTVVPAVGKQASDNMRNVYETVAADVERIAKEHVDRALALQQEVQTFSAMIRSAGMALCERIEREATRGYHVSKIMASARMLIQQGDPEVPADREPAVRLRQPLAGGTDPLPKFLLRDPAPFPK